MLSKAAMTDVTEQRNACMRPSSLPPPPMSDDAGGRAIHWFSPGGCLFVLVAGLFSVSLVLPLKGWHIYTRHGAFPVVDAIQTTLALLLVAAPCVWLMSLGQRGSRPTPWVIRFLLAGVVLFGVGLWYGWISGALLGSR